MKTVSFTLAVTLLASASSAFAQERELSRRQFPFFGNHLTVEVVADAPGKLQVLRGEEGMVEVAARVPGGVPGFALGGRGGDKLRLSALGGEHADFVIVVPEDATVRVKLPESLIQQTSTKRSGGVYIWGPPKETETKSSGLPASSRSPIAIPTPSGPTTAYTNDAAPRQLNVTTMNSLRTVTVRIEGTSFQVAGTEWMTVKSGNSNDVQVQPGKEPQDIIITVPAGTNNFTLRLGGRTALSVIGPEIRVYCEVTEQDLGAGRKWFTFAPEMGRLTCR